MKSHVYNQNQNMARQEMIFFYAFSKLFIISLDSKFSIK